MAEEMTLRYETLIRAAYRKNDKTVSRYKKPGADGDIYQRLDTVAYGVASGKVDPSKLNRIVGEVAGYIIKALKTVRKTYQDDEVFVEKIDDCLSLLDSPTKEKIDECIDKTWEAFRSIGLTVSQSN